jgi:hypothetical protein
MKTNELGLEPLNNDEIITIIGGAPMMYTDSDTIRAMGHMMADFLRGIWEGL